MSAQRGRRFEVGKPQRGVPRVCLISLAPVCRKLVLGLSDSAPDDARAVSGTV
jgi:hypothetical protein